MPTPPRSLAEDLRRRSDDQLLALVLARPDSVHPLPGSLGHLAQRLLTPGSVQRALDALTSAELGVLRVLADASLDDDGAGVDGALVLGPLAADAQELLQGLYAAALIWGSEEQPRVPTAVRQQLVKQSRMADLLSGIPHSRRASLIEDALADDSMGQLPAAQRRHLSSARTADAVAEVLLWPGRVARLLERAPAGALEVLNILAEDPAGVRQYSNAWQFTRTAEARSPVTWLLAYGLVVPVPPDQVVLPAEVSRVLTGASNTALALAPPELSGAVRDLRQVDRAAGTAAGAAVRNLVELLETWGLEQVPVLRSGGLGVKETKRAAELLTLDEPSVVRLLEVGLEAGLLAQDSAADPTWVPTRGFDGWQTLDQARQWAELVAAWLSTPRVPSLGGGRSRDDKRIPPLGADQVFGPAPGLRRLVLTLLAGAQPGLAPNAASITAAVAWYRPRIERGWLGDLVPWIVAEAELLGLLGVGALSSPGRVLVTTWLTAASDNGEDPLEPALDAAVAAMNQLLPEPLSTVILQPDLTAVAPGPLTNELSRLLRLVADVESTGGATVFRFSPASVRRALDFGHGAEDLLAALTAASRTGVPQPLEYLVRDLARRHGALRVGTAQAYIRCEDDALVGQVLSDRRSASLRPRRLAPGVLVLGAPVAEVLAKLRLMGLTPMPESPDGILVIRRPDARRAAGNPRLPQRPMPAVGRGMAGLGAGLSGLAGSTGVEASLARTAVSRWRATEALALLDPPPPPPVKPQLLGAAPLTVADLPGRIVNASDQDEVRRLMQEAIATASTLLVTSSDALGREASTLIQPTMLLGSTLMGRDPADGELLQLPISRMRWLARLKNSDD